jgi:hypothetical protein
MSDPIKVRDFDLTGLMRGPNVIAEIPSRGTVIVLISARDEPGLDPLGPEFVPIRPRRRTKPKGDRP